MTDKTESIMGDQGLKRLLGVLRPPAPSDLLRARVEKAIAHAPASGPTVGVSRAAARSGASRRSPQFLRLAASMLLIAGVALALWFPAPPREGGASVSRQTAAVVAEGDHFITRNAPATGRGTNIGVTLAGGDVAVAGISLVRADWSASIAGAGSDVGLDGDTWSELESIPLY